MAGALDRIAAAAKSPTFATEEAAAEYSPGLSRDEYALARVCASEFGSGSPTELCCIADSDVTKAAAKGLSIFDHVTGGTGEFGHQAHGSRRPVSTFLDPGPRHIEAALAVARRSFLGFLPPPMRGIARGAIQYLDARSQTASASSDPERNCPPLVILERWTFAKEWVDRSSGCELADAHGKGQLEWVGPIPGVDAFQLMLFRPAGPQQALLYADARKVIESKGAYQGSPLPGAVVDLALVAVLVGAAYLVKGLT